MCVLGLGWTNLQGHVGRPRYLPEKNSLIIRITRVKKIPPINLQKILILTKAVYDFQISINFLRILKFTYLSQTLQYFLKHQILYNLLNLSSKDHNKGVANLPK